MSILVSLLLCVKNYDVFNVTYGMLLRYYDQLQNIFLKTALKQKRGLLQVTVTRIGVKPGTATRGAYPKMKTGSFFFFFRKNARKFV